MIPSLHSAPFSNVSAALRGLGACVGGWHKRGFLGFALHWLLYRRLTGVRAGFEGLVARYLAGTVVRRVRSRSVIAAPVDAAPVDAAPVDAAALDAAGAVARVGRVWPARAGWLLRALQPGWLPVGQTASWEAGQFGAPLRDALETAEVQAMLREVPQASRLLGPVCRMLGIPTVVFRPGFVARVRAPAAKRVRVVRPKVDWGRVALPRGVEARARRDRALDRAIAEVARIRKATYGM